MGRDAAPSAPAAGAAPSRRPDPLLGHRAGAWPRAGPGCGALVRPGVTGLVIRPDGTTDYHAARLP
ncbi:hypothetical protein GAY30_30200 [Azospirillum brasilense]|nr:hypothetical protein [Azospirillum brasilense]